MYIIIALLVGLVVGVLAQVLMGGRLGWVLSIILGLVGGALGGWLFKFLPFYTGGIIWQIISGLVGACLILFVVRLIRK